MANTRAPNDGGVVTTVRLDPNGKADLEFLRAHHGGITVSAVVRLLIADGARSARNDTHRLAS